MGLPILMHFANLHIQYSIFFILLCQISSKMLLKILKLDFPITWPYLGHFNGTWLIGMLFKALLAGKLS